MDDQRERQGPGGMISTSAVQLMHDCTGRGPTKAKTMINENVVTVLLADTLTAGERHLVDNGRADRVLTLRHDFQLVMRDDARITSIRTWRSRCSCSSRPPRRRPRNA